MGVWRFGVFLGLQASNEKSVFRLLSTGWASKSNKSPKVPLQPITVGVTGKGSEVKGWKIIGEKTFKKTMDSACFGWILEENCSNGIHKVACSNVWKSVAEQKAEKVAEPRKRSFF